MIVGILGKAGSGKDTAADMLVQKGYDKLAFADPLKRFCMDIFDFSEEQLWGPSEKRSEPDKRYPRPRQEPLAGEDARVFYALEVVANPENIKSEKEFIKDFISNFLTPREALQTIGTQGARACYDEVWVKYAIRKSKQLLEDSFSSYDRTKGIIKLSEERDLPSGVIISDCRFENEILGIRNAGGKIIRINREGAGLKGKASQHKSETEQDGISDDLIDISIDNNGTLEELNIKLTQALNGKD